MRRWKSTNGDWEEIRPLGKGGQSEVFLVRGPGRVKERANQLDKIRELSGQGFNDSRAQEFADAVSGYVREERPSELGALKIYTPRADGPDADSQALSRLEIEIKTLHKSGRSGLLKVIDYDKRERWVVTEYYPRGTIKDNPSAFTGNAPLSLASFRDLVEAVAALHKDGIIHRDIKPDNVFMRADGRLVLGDFGIALPQGLPARVTRPEESVGPWEYRPPWADMVGRLDDVDASFDVYMLGKLLWCMVSGSLLLPREWYDRPEYDLTKRFPTDPQMYAINAILQKCLRDRADKCLRNASELLAVVSPLLNAMQRGGQPLEDDVPRPCRVCGVGFYRQQREHPTQREQTATIQWVTPKVPGRYAQPYANAGAILAEFLICDKCGHIQLFSIRS